MSTVLQKKRAAVKGYGRPLRIFSSSEFLHHKTHHELLRIYQFITLAKLKQVKKRILDTKIRICERI